MPYSASIVISPAGVPGVTADNGPYFGGIIYHLLLKNSGVALEGATPSALIPITFLSFR